MKKQIEELAQNGYAIINDIFDSETCNAILKLIETADVENTAFRRSKDLFAIRQFLKEIPESQKLIFTGKLKTIIENLFGSGYFVTKSIYFDKPAQSNWFVAYHQDLTISVTEKVDLPGYGPWSVKQNQFAVQPPLSILESNFTIRIHLDNTDKANGALKVIPGSHLKGIYRPETIDWNTETEYVCNVPKGSIMIMRPLLLHASGRSTNDEKRRVIHIEFGKKDLPEGLEWAEYLPLT